MRDIRIAARVLAKFELIRRLPDALRFYWDTGKNEAEIRSMINEMKGMKPFDIMNLVRSIPGVDKHDMSKFPVFKQEVKRAMKTFNVD